MISLAWARPSCIFTNFFWKICWKKCSQKIDKIVKHFLILLFWCLFIVIYAPEEGLMVWRLSWTRGWRRLELRLLPITMSKRQELSTTFKPSNILLVVQARYSETGFHIGMDSNFVCLQRRHNCRSQVINLSLSALISWFMKSIIGFLNNSNLYAIISTSLIIDLQWV
jgi:hypothetical protein